MGLFLNGSSRVRSTHREWSGEQSCWELMLLESVPPQAMEAPRSTQVALLHSTSECACIPTSLVQEAAGVTASRKSLWYGAHSL